VTHIIDKLAEFAPPGIPTHLLFPGVDFKLYRAAPADPAFRDEIGLPDDDRVIVFTGSNTFANEPEMRELYLAVALLNQRGIPTSLVRTGFNSPRFLEGLAPDVKRHVIDLGFIEKAKLPRLLALADVLVQPGHAGPFNDYRLPSKLPEFLASGRAVALPPANLAALMQNGREAVFLPTGTPAEIADTCERLFQDDALRAKLGANAVVFAREHFDLATNTRGLEGFYADTLARSSTTNWSLAADATTSDATLFAANLASQLNQAADSLEDPAARQLAAQTDLLAKIVRQLEQSIELSARHRIDAVKADRDAVLGREKLTLQHAKNLEDLLAAAREHAAGLEKARDMTQVYADNIGKELAQHKLRRDQADVLLRTARVQVTAYENALLGADAEIVALKDELASTKDDLQASREATAAERQAQEHLRAVHVGELAVAADRLAQTEAMLRSRDEKIAKMQSSFSWQITTPFRVLRRAFFDQPAPPAVSPKLLGNIDYPQDWSNIAPTLNVRGWSLHRDRVPLKAARAKLGDKSVSCEFGLERLDVLDHFRDYPGAERCGWIVKVDVPRRGTHLLVIEVQDESGTWHPAVARAIRRTANAAPPPPNTYAAWVSAYDSLTPEGAQKIRAKLATLKRRPKISVLMPTYNTPEKWLVAAIESVRRQLYENWELCISDDASKEPHVQKILERYRRRIPSASRSSSASATATSPPRRTTRSPSRTASSSRCSTTTTNCGRTRSPAWRSNSTRIPTPISFTATRTRSTRTATATTTTSSPTGTRPFHGPELHQPPRRLPHTARARGRRVPRRLRRLAGLGPRDARDRAHRARSHPAYSENSLPLAQRARLDRDAHRREELCDAGGGKGDLEHFVRVGVDATISPTKGSYWRIHYPVPDPAPRVTLIIPTRNRLNVLKPCVESLLAKTTYPNFEILIVDNDSDDPRRSPTSARASLRPLAPRPSPLARTACASCILPANSITPR
jgi:hypothetical protein